jgi:hypothetical protein
VVEIDGLKCIIVGTEKAAAAAERLVTEAVTEYILTGEGGKGPNFRSDAQDKEDPARRLRRNWRKLLALIETDPHFGVDWDGHLRCVCVCVCVCVCACVWLSFLPNHLASSAHAYMQMQSECAV